MAQVTIYLDSDTEHRTRAAAKAHNMSLSRWIAQLLKDRANDEWPVSVRQLAGAWKDFPTAEELRRDAGQDAARETI